MWERKGGAGREGGRLRRCLFFFQAEDGIRDIGVTGVQTCALPISAGVVQVGEAVREAGAEVQQRGRGAPGDAAEAVGGAGRHALEEGEDAAHGRYQIGRASRRGRVEILVVGRYFKQKTRWRERLST